MANLFKDLLPSGIKGSITYTYQKLGFYEVNENEYPEVQKHGNEYYQVYPITSTFKLELATTFEEYEDDYSVVVRFF